MIKLLDLFDLYCDMHDAKFEGQEAAIVCNSDLKNLFESEDLSEDIFHRICPEPDTDTRQLVPWRGLREILRFGDLKPLMPIFQEHPITAEDVNELNELEKENAIARQQKKREDLHDEWINKKRKFSKENDYRQTLETIEKHRHLAAHVRLNNHVRLHRLLMRVLGRLVDYAGLWERDLLFVTLALINLLGKQPKDVFDEKGLDHLKNGQIVKAIRGLREPQNKNKGAKEIFKRLKQVFGENFLDSRDRNKDFPINIRNNLAHFNMLQSDDNEPGLNLTEAVNNTRKLMAYDRKLKNAVTRSIKEMLACEGLVLSWCMEGHRLTRAKVKTRKAFHLGKKEIKEDLHGTEYVEMVADLFDGEVQSPNKNSEQKNQNRKKAKRRQKKKIPKPEEKIDCCVKMDSCVTMIGDHPQMKGDYTLP